MNPVAEFSELISVFYGKISGNKHAFYSTFSKSEVYDISEPCLFAFSGWKFFSVLGERKNLIYICFLFSSIQLKVAENNYFFALALNKNNRVRSKKSGSIEKVCTIFT